MSNKNRANDWLKQAENDYRWAMKGIEEEFYSQVCFMSQQAGEKAMKALAFFWDYDLKGHSIKKIATSIGFNGEIEEAARVLDLFYISARYPDAFAEGAPFEFYSLGEAKLALSKAKIIIDKAIAEIRQPE